MANRHTDIRLDKWLWAARFFKTRALAAEAVTGGKIGINGDRPKPSRIVRPGDLLTIRRGLYEWTVTVKVVARLRGVGFADATALRGDGRKREPS
jgi:ribosome-associated heat shock protein Hsp15